MAHNGATGDTRLEIDALDRLSSAVNNPLIPFLRSARRTEGSQLYQKLKIRGEIESRWNGSHPAQFPFYYGHWVGHNHQDNDPEAPEYVVTPQAFSKCLNAHPTLRPIPLTEAEALVLIKRHGIGMKTPLSLGIESMTMGMVFAVLLDVFAKYEGPDKYQYALAVSLSAMLLYPVFYNLLKKKFQDLPTISNQDLLKEGLLLGGLLLIVLTGLGHYPEKNLYAQPEIAGALVTVARTAIDWYEGRTLTNFNQETIIQALRNAVTTFLSFGTLVALLNAFNNYIFPVIPNTAWKTYVTHGINFVLIVAHINTIARGIGTALTKLDNMRFGDLRGDQVALIIDHSGGQGADDNNS